MSQSEEEHKLETDDSDFWEHARYEALRSGSGTDDYEDDSIHTALIPRGLRGWFKNHGLMEGIKT